MPSKVTQYRCLIISPSDVPGERDKVMNTIATWNAHVGKVFNQVVEGVAWERHAVPLLGDRPQNLFNPEVDSCDLGIAIFWSRLGTQTGDFDSGSVEEISRLQKAGKSVLVYFCNRAAPPSSFDRSELERLAKFRDELRQKGILQEFTGSDELGSLVMSHLTSVMQRLSGASPTIPDLQSESVGAPTRLTAPVPDVRVTAGSFRMLVQRPRGAYAVDSPSREDKNVFIVTVENHSPVPVFLSTVALEVEKPDTEKIDGLLMPLDLMNQSANQRIEPGNNFQFVYDKEILLRELGHSRLRAAVAFDKIGRRYETPSGEAEKGLRGSAG